MENYTLPYFGNIDLKNLDDYYDVDVDFNGSKIQMDLNFDHKNIDIERLEKVMQFIHNLDQYNEQNKKHIEQDYFNDDKDTVNTYVEWHLEEIGKDELADVIDLQNQSTSLQIQLIHALKLVRVGLYPDTTDKFAIFDYSIGRDLTDDLVVIFADENGQMDYMTMES